MALTKKQLIDFLLADEAPDDAPVMFLDPLKEKVQYSTSVHNTEKEGYGYTSIAFVASL